MIIGFKHDIIAVSKLSKKSDSFVNKKIDYKSLLIIAILAISYHIYISQIMENEGDLEFGNVAYGLSALVSGIAALYVGIRYRGSDIFGVTYTALGIGFLLLFAGDATYNYYEYVLDEDPYPSIVDVFFILYYPFVAYHLIRNIRYFKKDLSIELKLGISTLTVIIVLLFAIISFDEIEGHSFDFYFGLLFVFGSSVILSLVICGVAIFRQSYLE